MRHYKIAGLFITIADHGNALIGKMKPYEINAARQTDMTMVIDREKMLLTKERYPHLTLDEWEYIRTGFAFAHRLLDFDGFCLHSAAVALENQAILFSGPCGAGKSTHAGLWQQYFGSGQAIVINDDKPALRLRKNNFYAYGTPWSGKGDLHTNIKVPLGAVVFLKQAQENRIRRLDNREAVKMLVYQSLRPNSCMNKMNHLLTLLDALLQKTAVYQLDCQISPRAVELVYKTIYKEKGMFVK